MQSYGEHQQVGPRFIMALRAAATPVHEPPQSSLWSALRAAVLRLAVRGLWSLVRVALVAVAPAAMLGRINSQSSGQGAKTHSLLFGPSAARHACTMRGLTRRSTGAPTACHQRPGGGTRYIFTARALAASRWRPVTSNVRREIRCSHSSSSPTSKPCTHRRVPSASPCGAARPAASGAPRWPRTRGAHWLLTPRPPARFRTAVNAHVLFAPRPVEAARPLAGVELAMARMQAPAVAAQPPAPRSSGSSCHIVPPRLGNPWLSVARRPSTACLTHSSSGPAYCRPLNCNVRR